MKLNYYYFLPGKVRSQEREKREKTSNKKKALEKSIQQNLVSYHFTDIFSLK